MSLFGEVHLHITGPIHVHAHDAETAAKLDQLIALVTQQGATIMATFQELTDIVNAVAAEVPKVGDAINAMEAAITALKAEVGKIPPDAQAALDSAVSGLRSAADGLAAAVADAADGVDESVPTAEPPTEPTNP